MHGQIKLYLCDEEGQRFFGEGPYQLLRRIEQCGSLRSAAQEMNMAYTKAFRLIRRAEAELGFARTEKTIGGTGGGGSRLTAEAKDLMKRYEQYKSACARAAAEYYAAIFPEFGKTAPADHRAEGERENHSL